MVCAFWSRSPDARGFDVSSDLASDSAKGRASPGLLASCLSIASLSGLRLELVKMSSLLIAFASESVTAFVPSGPPAAAMCCSDARAWSARS